MGLTLAWSMRPAPMARNALRYVQGDYVLPLNEIPARLVTLVGESILEKHNIPIPRDIQFASLIAEQQLNTEEFLENAEAIGKRTTYTWPECGGCIWQIGAESLVRFRCHVGHSYSDLVFLAEQPSMWGISWGRRSEHSRRKSRSCGNWPHRWKKNTPPRRAKNTGPMRTGSMATSRLFAT
jgi:hypothetical protein